MDDPPKELVIYDFSPDALPSNVLAAIGYVCACSAYLENVIQMAIAGCLNVDEEYGQAVATHMTAPLRDSVLRSVAEIRIDDLNALNELDALLDETKIAFDKRNAVVHRSWCRHPTTDETYMIKTVARTRVESELIPMTFEEIRADGTLIYDLSLRLANFSPDMD